MKAVWATMALLAIFSFFAVADEGNAIIPVIEVDDVAKNVNFYSKVLGFKLVMAIPGKDGKLMHAEMVQGKNTIMFGKINPVLNSKLPKNNEKSSVFLYMPAQDIEGLYKALQESACKIVYPLENQFYGHRTFAIEDINGHRLMFWAPIPNFTAYFCESCGAPVAKDQKHCQFCIKPDGTLRSYDEVKKAMVQFSEQMGLEKSVAVEYVESALKKLPAWKEPKPEAKKDAKAPEIPSLPFLLEGQIARMNAFCSKLEAFAEQKVDMSFLAALPKLDKIGQVQL